MKMFHVLIKLYLGSIYIIEKGNAEIYAKWRENIDYVSLQNRSHICSGLRCFNRDYVQTTI